MKIRRIKTSRKLGSKAARLNSVRAARFTKLATR
jgi:hypothetical protein